MNRVNTQNQIYNGRMHSVTADTHTHTEKKQDISDDRFKTENLIKEEESTQGDYALCIYVFTTVHT